MGIFPLCYYFARRNPSINSNPLTRLSLRRSRQSERKYGGVAHRPKVGRDRVLDAKRNRIQGHERGETNTEFREPKPPICAISSSRASSTNSKRKGSSKSYTRIKLVFARRLGHPRFLGQSSGSYKLASQFGCL